MKIDYSETLKVMELSKVPRGDCFMLGDYIYMKTDENLYSASRCVNLKTGVITGIRDTTTVFCVDAKLCVRGISDDTDK